ncbi:SGNH/GDSL hydrolase family protein [Marinoscillum sp. MHG1-6]|uniref:SGNH/GDSL hydrolase family protein n=1 Tax=Marinoscillum sp. MHG1-6 TaxID=2959627 RepID=UPI0021582684|nr:SGNH/GDSL hydrolase family protein [Marinoscillum sp. MHG1-6]
MSTLILVFLLFSFCEPPEEPTKSLESEYEDLTDTIPEESHVQDNPMKEPEVPSKQKTFLALGDSYTIGEAVDEDQRWPVQLVTKLLNDSVKIDAPTIIARTGWTTNELLAAIALENVVDTFDIVSLLIGVNNQYRGYPIDQQKREFDKLLQQAISFAGGDTSRVFVVSIPDYSVTPFGQSGNPEKTAREIDLYNSINDSIADLYQVQYFDITPISREAASNPDLIASDGLHPSEEMYRRWVELMFSWSKSILSQ